MKIQFWGAAQTVTGSMHLLEVNGHRLLLDCGLYQGRRKDAFRRNRDLPFDASSIDAVVLSHAHIDHSGNLPSLVRAGFRGPVWCTSATRDVCAFMLVDSAHIQESDVKYVNKRRKRQKKTLFEPLYTIDDALETLGRFMSADYGRRFEPVPGVTVHFRDAGHILGSALVVLDVAEEGDTKRLVFSGDIGRGGLAILRDPQTVEDADVIIMESTYGNRHHESTGEAKDALRQVIQDTCGRRNGKVLIPAFAMGRTQEIIYRLNELWNAEELPPVNTYVDSPLAIRLTDVFRIHPECYDREMMEAVQIEDDNDPLGWSRLHFLRSVDGSKSLNEMEGPAVIVSASGMLEGGRILHHVKNHVGDPRNTVLFVGYQAEHTLGRRILDGRSPVKVFGNEIDVRASIERVDGYSAHADRDELLSWAAGLRDRGQVHDTFLVHGELESLDALSQGLRDEVGFTNVIVPERGQSFEL